MEDKRKDRRYSVHTSPIKCSMCDNEETLLHVEDVSCSGFGMTTKERVVRGDKLEVEIIIPGDDIPLFVKTEVTWVKRDKKAEEQYNAGLKFRDIHPNDKKRLIKYIDSCFVSII